MKINKICIGLMVLNHILRFLTVKINKSLNYHQNLNQTYNVGARHFS